MLPIRTTYASSSRPEGKSCHRPCCRMLWAGMVLAQAAATSGTVVHSLPMSGGGAIELGQIYGIDQKVHDEYGSIPSNWTLHRTIGWFQKELIVDERLHLRSGIAGLFYYNFPYNTQLGIENSKRSALSISELFAAYSWGDPDRPPVKLTVGQQRYKYNPDARNLGEYLFRSQAYPTLINGGSWSTILAGGAVADIWGANLETRSLGGALRQDILATLSVELAPLYDLSLTYIAGFNLGGILDLGAGFNLNRLVPVRPSVTTPDHDESTYFEWDGCPQGGCRIWIEKNAFGEPIGDTARLANLAPGTYSRADKRSDVADVILSDSIPKRWRKISFRDVKFMARASLDIQAIFGGLEMLGREDLRLYAEVAVLGWENYPLYYTDRWDRTPVMAGFNLPAFRLADRLSVEVERMTNPWLNDSYQLWLYAKPVPHVRQAQKDMGASWEKPVAWTRDDIKWSLNAEKQVSVFRFMLQVASDHLKPIDRNIGPSTVEAMTEGWQSWTDWGSWYFTLRAQMAL